MFCIWLMPRISPIFQTIIMAINNSLINRAILNETTFNFSPEKSIKGSSTHKTRDIDIEPPSI